MIRTHRDRANTENESDDKESTDSTTPWPKRGLAGKTSSAQTHAPPDASDIEILTVGYVAWNESRDVESVWAEVRNNEIQSYGGAE